MTYRRCGWSGLRLPAVSLGLWHNFGANDDTAAMHSMVTSAFDLGITHFDLANNYGPPPGSAEESFGRILHGQLQGYRDELIISTKAGYTMWPGPYGEMGSRKHILASLEQSLKRLRTDHVDIFYSHRPDSETPLDETMSALESAVLQGKAIYVGISNYKEEQCQQAMDLLTSRRIPLLIQQSRYSMFNRGIESTLLPLLQKNGVGCIAFSPLAQGLLSDRYLKGIPDDSRAGRDGRFLSAKDIREDVLAKVRQLQALALQRSQTLSQMALAWVLSRPEVTSVLIGASRKEQICDNVGALTHLEFTAEQLLGIETILTS